ncbi:MAG TPA: PAS domain S-box protein, partial [Albitalea sp.]
MSPLPERLREEMFRRLVEAVTDYAIFMLTPEGRVATWNAGAERIKGFRAEDILGQHFSRFYAPEAVASGWPDEELRRAAQIGRFEDEGWRLRADGTRFWANVVITALRGADGELLGFSKITRDLTERRRNEERLRESERSFRQLVEVVEDYAIFMLDATGHIASWNLGAQRINGYTAAEILGQHFSKLYRAEDIARGLPQQALEVAAERGRFEDEGWRVRKDGSLLWADVIMTAIYDEHGALRGFSKITRDLTERRLQEHRLKESEENFRLLVEGVKDHAIILLDSEGAVKSWNAGAERLQGFRAEEVLGRSAAVFYTEEDVAAGKPQTELAIARNAGFSEDVGWRLKRDGSRFWADVTLTALRDRDGSPRGFAQITRDMSERRRVQELESEGQRINEFIAMLAHELRNPLAPIGNAVGILEKVGDTPELKWVTQLIDRQVQHLSRLVDDLLDVSRITSGKIQVHKEPLELNAVVRAAAESVRPTVEARGHTFDVQLASRPIHIQGDPTRLTQVIVNLVTNASKYTPDGGRVALSVEQRGAMAYLHVVDNGIGMSKQLIETAFDLFVQGDRTLDRAQGGLGIGLTLVKRIVTLHGGRVQATSAGLGHGTEFTVSLPVSGRDGGRPRQPGRSRAGAPPGRKVLVVDDNVDAVESLAALLNLSGHHVVAAHEGRDALRLAADDPPDLVLLDLGLPGMDGYEVARRLRALPGLETTRLVAMTGYGQEEHKRATGRAGFDAHLVKPVEYGALLRELA